MSGRQARSSRFSGGTDSGPTCHASGLPGLRQAESWHTLRVAPATSGEVLRCSTLEQIGVRDLRQQASRYLRRVAAGESFVSPTTAGRSRCSRRRWKRCGRSPTRCSSAGRRRRVPVGRRRGRGRRGATRAAVATARDDAIVAGYRRTPRPTTTSRPCGRRGRSRRAVVTGRTAARSGGARSRRSDDVRSSCSRVTYPDAAHRARVPATRTVRGIPTEVAIGPDDGMPRCALSFDNATVLDQSLLVERICRLDRSRRPPGTLPLRAERARLW